MKNRSSQKKLNIALLAGLGLGLIVVSQSLFIVDQREQAIVLQLGQPVGATQDPASFIKGPGVHVKIPIVQDVRYFDRRVISVDPPPEQVVISSGAMHAAIGPVLPQSAAPPAQDSAKAPADVSAGPADAAPEPSLAASDAIPKIENVSGEPIIVDTFARYRITDPLQFLKTLRSVDNANSRLLNVLNDATRAVLGGTTLPQLLSSGREDIMTDIKDRVNRKIEQDRLGIAIVDVRIVRADLTPDLGTSTVRRMISELKERATETRAKGEERALEIRSTAEKERTVILAEATRDAQSVKGEGDNEAIKIYTQAFNKDKNFYGFVRSMEAYKKTFKDDGDTQVVLSPDSGFLKYMKDANGNAGP